MTSIIDVSACRSILRSARRWGAVFLAGSVVYSSCASFATAATFTLLQSFTLTGPSDPEARLTQGPDGNFYGTSHVGSTYDCGTVYEVTPAGVLSTVHEFNCTDGAEPDAALTLGADGNFYGVTQTDNGSSEEAGEIFKVSPSGAFSVVHLFTSATDGAGPSSALLLAADGNFYGVTSYGGTGGLGSVYRLTPAGVFTVIHMFSSAEGANFGGGLVQAADGNFYGVSGGACGNSVCTHAGNVYRMTPAGTFTNLYEFTDGADGGFPTGSLVVGSDGNLYGTTNSVLGPAGNGTIFKITTAGVLTTMHTFTGSDGYVPVGGLVQAGDGNFYGVTRNGGTGCSNGACGTVFSISPSGTFTNVYDFTAGNDGKYPAAGLVVATSGILYGTASSSGFGEVGTVFTITLGSPPPQAPPPPTGLAATGGNAQAVLAWTAAAGATSYNVYDGTSAGGESSTPIMTGITGTGFTVTGLSNGTAYYFKVASVDANGTSALSNEASATPTAPVTPLPGQVTGLTATAHAGQVVLNWAAPANATGYTINAGTTSGGETMLTGGVTTTTYTATGLTNGTTYYFTVVATDSAGSGPASTEASATPSAGTAATPAFSPAGGTFTTAQSVTLSDGTPGASLYYTLDGSTPTASSILYKGPISVAESTTIKVVAAATGYVTSAVASATFTIQPPPVQTAPTALSGSSGGGALGVPEVLGLLALLLLRGAAKATRRGWTRSAETRSAQTRSAETWSAEMRSSAMRSAVPSQGWMRFMAWMRSALPLPMSLVLLGFATASARAQDLRLDWSSLYVGLRAGTAEYATSASDLDQAFSAAGFSGTNASLERHRTVGDLHVGVPFYGPLSLEIGYVDLGRYPVTITTRSTAYQNIASVALDTLRPTGRGATLGLGAPIDLGRWFALEPHVALLVSQSKQEVWTPLGAFTDNRHDTGIAAGLGLLFRPTNHWYLGGGVDCWGAGAHCDVLAYTGQIQYRFGSAP